VNERGIGAPSQPSASSKTRRATSDETKPMKPVPIFIISYNRLEALRTSIDSYYENIGDAFLDGYIDMHQVSEEQQYFAAHCRREISHWGVNIAAPEATR
jgi:hypothetical protein